MQRWIFVAVLLLVCVAPLGAAQAAPIAQDSQSNAVGDRGRKDESSAPSIPQSAQERVRAEQQVKALVHTLGIEGRGMSLHYPDGWSAIPSQYGNAQEMQNAPADKIGASARMIITTEARGTHADAVNRLREIASEVSSPAVFLSIGGWPALQRRHLAPRERFGEMQLSENADEEMVLKITTAIAVADTLVRLETRLEPDVKQDLIVEVEAIGRSMESRVAANLSEANREIEYLRNSPSLRSQPFPTPPPQTTTPKQKRPPLNFEQDEKEVAPAQEFTPIPLQVNPTDPGGAIQVLSGTSEIEVAASNNGRNIIVAAGRNFATSNDGGRTFPFTGGLPFANRGDISLAFGQSGNFYFAGINNTAGCSTSGGCATGINVSTNNGQTFTFRSNAVTCPSSGMNVCFPDQEHIGADRFNAGTGTQDQVYSVWRNFAASFAPSIVCSNDSATNWTAPVAIDTSGDFPRVTVGQDGFVYVAYVAGGNMMIHKYSSCRTGLTPQTMPMFPRMVATFNDVACPVPGLDRCNSGNVLASPVAAVDDTNPNHIFFAYATNTGSNNDDVMVHHSTDGGFTWSAGVRVNAAVPGRRFMPWIGVTNGIAYISWYDRRASTPCAAPPCAANNDLTDFYRGSVSLSGGNLVAGPEVKITQAADPQCASGWPCQTRAMTDSESCSVIRQFAGICKINPLPMPDISSNAACDFSDCPGPMCTCMAGEQCQTVPSGGCPKYGDYNGMAAAGGRVMVAWASATAPPAITPAPPAGINVYTQVDIVSAAQIQVPSAPNFPDTCVGSTSKATLNVCNTGTTDLEVQSIVPSNSQFTVTTPSAGFPLLIGPGSCFPFETNFTPTGMGAASTMLTVNSNDPVNPMVKVNVTAQGEKPRLATLIADTGDFGKVCVGSFKDLNLTLNNSGGCSLSVTNITSNNPEFQMASVLSLPLTIEPGDSLQVPIRFQPTSFGVNKMANITIASNDMASPKVVTVKGTAPKATIVVPPLIEFAKTCPGDSSNRTLTIGNSGECDLIVSGITSSSLEFKVVGIVPFPLVIPPGSTRDVMIQFMPMGFNINPVHMATLTIISNDLNNPSVTVTVKGIVPPPVIQAMPDPLDYGKVCLGTFKDLPLTIKNTGECNLTVSGIAFSSPEFKLSSPVAFPFVIPPGGMRDVMIRFEPTSTGVKSAKITINSDDPATPNKMVTVMGIAPVSDIAITGPTDFGTVSVGSSRQQVLNIANTEPCDLLITLVCELTTAGVNIPSTEFNLARSLVYPVLIPGGGTLPVAINFSPARTGPRAANLFVCGYDPKTPGLVPMDGCPMFSNIKRIIRLTGKGK